MDLPQAAEHLRRLAERVRADGRQLFAVSAATGEALRQPLHVAFEILQAVRADEAERETEKKEERIFEATKKDEPLLLRKFTVRRSGAIRGRGRTTKFMARLTFESGYDALLQRLFGDIGITRRCAKQVRDGDTVRVEI